MTIMLIVLFVGIALLTYGSVVLYKTRNCWDTPILAMFATAAGVTVILVAVVFLIVGPIESNKALDRFLTQKEYIESYEPTSEYDTAAIASKKIELNTWLYDVQYTRKHHPMCSFYGDEILDVEPIK